MIMFAVLLSSAILLSPPADSDTASGAPLILRFSGDCLLADHYEDAVGEKKGDSAFVGFDLLNTADISCVNLECPVTIRGEKIKKPYNFRMNPSFLSALSEAGIDIVNIANNHIFDYGRQGLFDTISYLDSVGLWHVGAGRTELEAEKPVIVQAGTRRIGFQGYYGGGEAPVASGKDPGVVPRSLPVILADIDSLRKRDSVDYVVVVLHWGTEKATEPDGGQIRFAHALIDGGADAVIGHHPHVLQGIEKYKSGVIVYSLGNFVFGGNSRDTYDTGLFEIALGERSVSYRFIPVRLKGWKLMALAGHEADAVMSYVSKLSSIFPHSIFSLKETR
jgi:poly-gamma-glutamate capsule biosynthesis protein CapA/YwtB (metallophosphatase superfamily)